MLDPADAVEGYVVDILAELAESDLERLEDAALTDEERCDVTGDIADREAEWVTLWGRLTALITRLRHAAESEP